MSRAQAQAILEPGAPSHGLMTDASVSPRWSPRVTLFDPDAFGSAPRRNVASANGPDVLRPIQYLGNKQRSLSTVLSVIDSLTPTGGAVADFFTGTSVVAQGIAGLGRRAFAVDVSRACATIATATLGVGRAPADAGHEQLAAMLRGAAADVEAQLEVTWSPFLHAEDHALAAGAGRELIELDRLVPQVWRQRSTPPLIAGLFEAWGRAASTGQHHECVVSPVFAGTYFGVRQAIQLDARRAAISGLVARRLVSPWEEAVLITALLAGASLAAFSPGKHFAQPHRTDGDKDLTFHAGRVLSDRAVNVAAMVDEWIERLCERSRAACEGHLVLRQNVDDVTPDELVANGVAAVYADPPYTAQQYSRFYHALDTLAEGSPKRLQLVNGEVTAGLYPDGRYLSPYCSKRQARPAFTRLAALCRKADATLLLSYSSSAKDSTGNARMISLPALVGVLATTYGRDAIEIVEFTHQYRQFNHRDAARASRSDPEVLVIAHAA